MKELYKITPDGKALIKANKNINPKIADRLGYVLLIETQPPQISEGDELIVRYEYVIEERPCPHGVSKRLWERNPRRFHKTGIKTVYEVITPPPPPESVYTYDDYNRALEDYLREVRVERGYTDREPTEYIDSKVPRWDSDGRDYRSFRDDVMLYALPILNEYKETGNAPTLAEFKAGFPKMVWSYTEEV